MVRKTAVPAPSLFQAAAPRPLADALRPQRLEDIAGQEHLLAEGGPLPRMLGCGRLRSLILWGPPGCGKTTLARLLARQAGCPFVTLSALSSGVAELRAVFAEAQTRHRDGQASVLFVDEIHRFSRAQQDAFLPVVEEGSIILIGATTENPSFALNAALLSRMEVLVLRRLDDPALEKLLHRAEEHAGQPLALTGDARAALCALADGDGRYLLTLAEDLFSAPPPTALDSAALLKRVQKRRPLYDKAEEGHYNLISALHKSLRGSDPDAALYWLARMLVAGEDPYFIARRLVRFASEDVGLADPAALPQALAGWQAYERLGSPEGELALVQVCLYLACAPKSNALYRAQKNAWRVAQDTGSLMPPAHILNAPTKLMKDLGYGAGYVYDPDTPTGFSGQSYFPDGMARAQFYAPKGDGVEARIKERLQQWQALRQTSGA